MASFFAVFQFGFIPKAYASLTTEQLWVNGFTSTETSWIPKGASPYLDAIEVSNRIETTTRNIYESRFGYADSSNTANTLSSVQVCVYAYGAGDDQVQVSIYNGSTNTIIGAVTPTTTWQWYNQSCTTVLNTWTKVNSAALRVQSLRVGGTMSNVSVDASVLTVTSTPVVTWEKTNLAYRQSAVITSASGANVSYQIPITIVNDAGTSSGNVMHENNRMRSDFGDVLFYSNDNTTSLNYWQESVTSNVNSTFWVKMPSDNTYGNLSSTNQTVWIYYGNSTMTSASNIYTTFLFGDGFESNDFTYWSSVQTTYWKIISSPVKDGSYAAQCNTAADYYLRQLNASAFQVPAACQFWFNPNTTADKIVFFPCFTTSPTIKSATLYTLANGSLAIYNTATIPICAYSTNTWYKAIYLLGSGSTFNVLIYNADGTLRGNLTTNYRTDFTYTYNTFDFYGGDKEVLDDAFVRSYTGGAEPGNGAWTAEEPYTATVPSTPATIQDFLINNTATGSTTQFAFYVSDSVALQNCTFSNDNGTGTWANSSLSLSGTGPTYANFTVNPFSVSTLLNFTFWVWNTNSTLSPATIGYRTLAIYNTSMPYTSLGKAISAIETANNWTQGAGVDPYSALVLNQNTTTQYESVIDGYAMGTAKSVTNATFSSSSIDSSAGTVNWTNPTYAYDNNLATGASVVFPSASNSYYLVLNFSTTVGAKYLQYYVHRSSSTIVFIDVDVYTAGSWLTIISSSQPTWDSSTNITVGPRIISAVRYRFESNGAVTVWLNETQSFDAYQFDYLNALAYCAYSEKMDLDWSNKQTDILNALGNISMVGSLPYTDIGAYQYSPGWPYGDFGVWNKWALYGYYYANNSWASSQLTKWNITAAYNQFDAGVAYSVAHSSGLGTGMPNWIFADGTGYTMFDRYYDEDAECIQDYLIFYSLLNISAALTQAEYYWSYLNANHWNPDDTQSKDRTLEYYRYSNIFDAISAYELECEAGFFLKIISILKYYSPNLGNYSRVLSDIGLRFLASEWNSYQWMLSNGTSGTAYAVTHLYTGNPETRLTNTLGAWQALLGAYLQFNSTYQSNMKDMLAGNVTSNIQPAWSLLMGSTANLWVSETKLFKSTSNDNAGYANPTAKGEITLFQLGIIPGTSTVAFPLEELGYEYTFDIDPYMMAFALNSTMRTVTVPVVQAGTITFQYGESPITQTFNLTGVYIISFSSSWNMILSVTYQSALPSYVIYFYLPPPPAYDLIGPSSAMRATVITAYTRWYSAGNFVMSNCSFNSNATGSWGTSNQTLTVANSSLGWGTVGPAWGNFSLTMPSAGTTQCQWWAWDNNGVMTSTGLWTITITALSLSFSSTSTLQSLSLPTIGIEKGFLPSTILILAGLIRKSAENTFSFSNILNTLSSDSLGIEKGYVSSNIISVLSSTASSSEKGFSASGILQCLSSIVSGIERGFTSSGQITLSSLTSHGIEKLYNPTGLLASSGLLSQGIEKGFTLSNILTGLSSIVSGIENFFTSLGSLTFSSSNILYRETGYMPTSSITIFSTSTLQKEKGYMTSGIIQTSTTSSLSIEKGYTSSGTINLLSSLSTGLEKAFTSSNSLQTLSSITQGKEQGFSLSNGLISSSLLSMGKENMFNPSEILALSSSLSKATENLFSSSATAQLFSSTLFGKERLFSSSSVISLSSLTTPNIEKGFLSSNIIQATSSIRSNLERLFSSTGVITLSSASSLVKETGYSPSSVLTILSGLNLQKEKGYSSSGIITTSSTASSGIEKGYSSSSAMTILATISSGIERAFHPTETISILSYVLPSFQIYGIHYQYSYIISESVSLISFIAKAAENTFRISGILTSSSSFQIGNEKSFTLSGILASSSSSLMGKEKLFSPSNILAFSSIISKSTENLFSQIATIFISSSNIPSKETGYYPTNRMTVSSIWTYGNEKGFSITATITSSATTYSGIEKLFGFSEQSLLSDSTNTTVYLWNNYVYARFVYNPSNPQPGQTVNFNANQSSSSYPITNYLWNFGDGTVLNGNSTISHIFQSNGVYPVTLTVTGTSGLQDSFTIPVIVGTIGGITDHGGFTSYITTLKVNDLNLTSNPSDKVMITLNFTFTTLNGVYTNQSIFVIEGIDFPQPLNVWAEPFKLPAVYTNQTGIIPITINIPNTQDGVYTGQITITASDPWGNILTAYASVTILVRNTRSIVPPQFLVGGIIVVILIVIVAMVVEDRWKKHH